MVLVITRRKRSKLDKRLKQVIYFRLPALLIMEKYLWIKKLVALLKIGNVNFIVTLKLSDDAKLTHEERVKQLIIKY